MRKKSHISLARYIVAQSTGYELHRHKLAFYLGSILPDCKPSFLYRRHEIKETFDDVRDEIFRLADEADTTYSRYKYYRNLGQITHYVADYFTFPHNDIYKGSLSEHCIYEENLKVALREYLTGGQAEKDFQPVLRFQDAEEIAEFIQAAHEEYLEEKIDVDVDISYIVKVNHQIVEGILAFTCQEKTRFVPAFDGE